MHFFYLHGFASSPRSGKAMFFRDRLAARGWPLDCLDLNLPDFASLTVSRMIGQLDSAIERRPPGPVVLIGSSLGGFAALHAAARRHDRPGSDRPVIRLILLAPALDFASDRDTQFDAAELDEWRLRGEREVEHYGFGRKEKIGFGLYTDGRRYDSTSVRLDVPILLLQGSRDDVVSPAAAVEFAATRPGVTLRMLDDDHQLQGHREELWKESAAFLGLDAS